MELIRSFTPEQFAQGLESWQWIGIGARTPRFTSPFGDVFLQAEDGIWFLDTVEGRLLRIWDSTSALKADLNTASGQDRYLLAGLAASAERQGLTPAPGQVYGFKIPPVLGGELDLANIEVIDFVVGLHIAGQIHDQVRTLPPGTPISGVTITGDSP